MIGIEIRDLSKKISGNRILYDVNTQLPAGSVIGILGPTASGKTTLMRILTGILEADEGEIIYKKEEVEVARREYSLMGLASKERGWIEFRRSISYMPENRGLYPTLPLEEQILYILRLKGLSESEAREALERWRLRIGIGKLELQYAPLKLPRSIQQKAFLILVLATEPQLVVLDDPFAGLDPATILDMEQLIQELAQQGTTIIFSTPHLEEADSLCEYVLMMHKGRILVEGITEQVRREFAQPEYEIVVSTPIESLEWPPEVTVEPLSSHKARIFLSDPSYARCFLEKILPQTEVHSFRQRLPSLKEIFKDLEDRSPHYM